MENYIHSSSPKSVAASPIEMMSSAFKSSSKKKPMCQEMKDTFTLEEFVEALPGTIREVHNDEDHEKGSEGNLINENCDPEIEEDPIAALFSRLVLDKDEWERYALFESNKNYTRNLISTDNETYTLLLMCWNPDKESPIHDHPCDGCWMRVCEGTVHECRYKEDEDDDGSSNDKLICFSDEMYSEGQLAYINDIQGFHKVGNPSLKVPAITMHLYSPPFQTCKVWLDPNHVSRPSKSCMCYHSEYGIRI